MFIEIVKKREFARERKWERENVNNIKKEKKAKEIAKKNRERELNWSSN